MSTEPSKYAENQFKVSTVGRFPLMDELLSDSLPKLTVTATAIPFFSVALSSLGPAKSAWDAGYSALTNKEAQQFSCTAQVEDYMASVTRKPNLDTNSPLETWDSTIRAAVPYQGTVYRQLLPYGRETLTEGSIQQRIDAEKDFASRLLGQSSFPALVALGNTVLTFYGQAESLRTVQLTCLQEVSNLRDAQEVLRVTAAEALYEMTGYAMVYWKGPSLMVDSLFDVNLMRSTPQVVPGPAGAAGWDAGTRTLSTAELPVGATRLEAWRLGPGGAPERLATGEIGAASVVVPANVTWDSGDLYQLWLVGRNARGTGEPGPTVSWTAP